MSVINQEKKLLSQLCCCSGNKMQIEQPITPDNGTHSCRSKREHFVYSLYRKITHGCRTGVNCRMSVYEEKKCLLEFP